MKISTRRRDLIRLFSLIAGLRVKVAIGACLILSASALTLTYPMIIARLVDGAVTRGGLGALLLLGSGLFVLFLARSTLAFFGGFILEAAGEETVNRLRKKLFHSLMRRDFGFFATQRVGDLGSRLHSDTATIRDAVNQSIVAALNQAFLFIGALLAMGTVNWRLTLLVLFVSPFAAAVSSRFGPLLESASRDVRTNSAEALATASEAFLGIQTVHVLNRQRTETQKYERLVDATFRAAIKSVRLSSVLGGVLSFLSSLVTVAVFVYGGYQVVVGSMTAGALVAFLFYSESITQSVSAFSAVYANLLSALGSSSSVFDLLEQAALDQDKDKIAKGASSLNALDYLSVDEISFSYGRQNNVLAAVSFSARRGEIFGLVGRSGSGKSTCASIICRLHDSGSGMIRLDGRDIRRIEPEALRIEVTLVTQDTFLFNESIFENIRNGRPGASHEEIMEAARFACLTDLAVSLPHGFDTIVGERGAMLSGGQKQRIAIARAILRGPSLLILDEATSALDAGTERAIVQNVAARCRSQGMCAMIITHRPAVMELLDNLFVLENGRLTQQGGYCDLQAQEGPLGALLMGVRDKEGYRVRPLAGV